MHISLHITKSGRIKYGLSSISVQESWRYEHVCPRAVRNAVHTDAIRNGRRWKTKTLNTSTILITRVA